MTFTICPLFRAVYSSFLQTAISLSLHFLTIKNEITRHRSASNARAVRQSHVAGAAHFMLIPEEHKGIRHHIVPTTKDLHKAPHRSGTPDSSKIWEGKEFFSLFDVVNSH